VAKRLFKDLIWPAAAGNVGWAFFTIALQDELKQTDTWAKLIVLALVAFYLGMDWLRIEYLPEDTPTQYWIFDGLLMVAIVVFAIATQLGKSWLDYSLALIFGTAMLGHLVGAWDPQDVDDVDRWPRRGVLFTINGIGMVILAISFWNVMSPPWNRPISIGLVLVFLMLFRRMIVV
jgi:hypothetical protein